MKEKYLDVDKVWYTDKENVKEEKEANYIVRNIESISDYLRGIINILSVNCNNKLDTLCSLIDVV